VRAAAIVNKRSRGLAQTSETRMINTALAAALATVCLIAPGFADEATPDDGGGRFMFSKIADGFLRLDTQTGEVSVCSQRTVGWTCQASPEDRAVLENEIARLRQDNAALKKELIARGLPLPAGIMPEPQTAPRGERQKRLDSDSDLDRVIAMVGRMWRQILEAIARAEKQALPKT
jgi:hypothetical protein